MSKLDNGLMALSEDQFRELILAGRAKERLVTEEQAVLTAKADLERHVYDAMDAGVPVKMLADHVQCSVSNIYAMRDIVRSKLNN